MTHRSTLTVLAAVACALGAATRQLNVDGTLGGESLRASMPSF